MVDVEKFIVEIQNRPTIYDSKSPGYNDRTAKEKSWMEVGKEVIDNWDELSERDKKLKVIEMYKKWKSIRDNYVKELWNEKKRELGIPKVKQKEYRYKHLLHFLGPLEETESTNTYSGHLRSKRLRQFNGRKLRSFKKEDSAEEGSNGDEGEHVGSTLKIMDVKSINAESFHNQKKRSRTTQHQKVNVKPKKKINDEEEEESLEIDNSDKFGNRSFLLSFVPILNQLNLQSNIEFRCKVSEAIKEVVNSENICVMVSDTEEYDVSDYYYKDSLKRNYESAFLVESPLNQEEVSRADVSENQEDVSHAYNYDGHEQISHAYGSENKEEDSQVYTYDDHEEVSEVYISEEKEVIAQLNTSGES